MDRCNYIQCSNKIWCNYSAGNAHDGQEVTILSLSSDVYHWIAIVVTPGFIDNSIYNAGSNPYGTTVTVDSDGNMVEDVKDAVKHQAKRTIEVAEMNKKGKS